MDTTWWAVAAALLLAGAALALTLVRDLGGHRPVRTAFVAALLAWPVATLLAAWEVLLGLLLSLVLLPLWLLGVLLGFDPAFADWVLVPQDARGAWALLSLPVGLLAIVRGILGPWLARRGDPGALAEGALAPPPSSPPAPPPPAATQDPRPLAPPPPPRKG